MLTALSPFLWSALTKLELGKSPPKPAAWHWGLLSVLSAVWLDGFAPPLLAFNQLSPSSASPAASLIYTFHFAL